MVKIQVTNDADETQENENDGTVTTSDTQKKTERTTTQAPHQVLQHLSKDLARIFLVVIAVISLAIGILLIVITVKHQSPCPVLQQFPLWCFICAAFYLLLVVGIIIWAIVMSLCDIERESINMISLVALILLLVLIILTGLYCMVHVFNAKRLVQFDYSLGADYCDPTFFNMVFAFAIIGIILLGLVVTCFVGYGVYALCCEH